MKPHYTVGRPHPIPKGHKFPNALTAFVFAVTQPRQSDGSTVIDAYAVVADPRREERLREIEARFDFWGQLQYGIPTEFVIAFSIGEVPGTYSMPTLFFDSRIPAKVDVFLRRFSQLAASQGVVATLGPLREVPVTLRSGTPGYGYYVPVTIDASFEVPEF